MIDFINYNSEIFKTTVSLMQKYNLCSHNYQDWVDPSEYEENEYDEIALDVCNRLYEHYYHGDFNDNVNTVKEIFYFWNGQNAIENKDLISKLKSFLKDLLKEYKKIEKKQKEQLMNQKLLEDFVDNLY